MLFRSWLARGMPRLNIEGTALPVRQPAIGGHLSAAVPSREPAASASGASPARSRSDLATEGAEG